MFHTPQNTVKIALFQEKSNQINDFAQNFEWKYAVSRKMKIFLFFLNISFDISEKGCNLNMLCFHSRHEVRDIKMTARGRRDMRTG